MYIILIYISSIYVEHFMRPAESPKFLIHISTNKKYIQSYISASVIKQLYVKVLYTGILYIYIVSFLNIRTHPADIT